jgi:hypothetical protein
MKLEVHTTVIAAAKTKRGRPMECDSDDSGSVDTKKTRTQHLTGPEKKEEDMKNLCSNENECEKHEEDKPVANDSNM